MYDLETKFEVEPPSGPKPNFHVIASRPLVNGRSTFYLAEFKDKGEAHALADALQHILDNPPAARRRDRW